MKPSSMPLPCSERDLRAGALLAREALEDGHRALGLGRVGRLDHERPAEVGARRPADEDAGVAHPAEHVLAQVQAGLLLELAEQRVDADAGDPAAAGHRLQDAVEGLAEVGHAEAQPRVAGQRGEDVGAAAAGRSPTSASRC